MQHFQPAWRSFLAFAALLGLAACEGAPTQEAAGGAPVTPPGYKVVLVAGDGSLPVFDNAVTGIETRLQAQRGDQDEIWRLSGTPAIAGHYGVGVATVPNVLQDVARMHPGPSQGCFVYTTSHGGKYAGVFLRLTGEFLAPQALDQALLQGCGDAPTAVVVSSCYSGIFAKPPMTRPNRVILTAARPDRTSFGCRAGRIYTVYDKCLLDALDAGGTWKQAYATIKTCVSAEEQRESVVPSEPQAWFGTAVADMKLPVQP